MNCKAVHNNNNNNKQRKPSPTLTKTGPTLQLALLMTWYFPKIPLRAASSMQYCREFAVTNIETRAKTTGAHMGLYLGAGKMLVSL